MGDANFRPLGLFASSSPFFEFSACGDLVVFCYIELSAREELGIVRLSLAKTHRSCSPSKSLVSVYIFSNFLTLRKLSNVSYQARGSTEH